MDGILNSVVNLQQTFNYSLQKEENNNVHIIGFIQIPSWKNDSIFPDGIYEGTI